MINRAFGSEELERKDVTIFFENGKSRVATLTLDRNLPFLRFNEAKEVITGTIYSGRLEIIHQIEDNPATWIVNKRLWDIIKGCEITTLRVRFNDHEK